jgi:DNA mismatch endonuclease, patch repair protein
VFVDGCFWHGCPDHGQLPAANREFWKTKLEATRKRDRRQTVILEEAGWRVIRVWEHESVIDASAQIIASVAGDGMRQMHAAETGRPPT